MTQREKEIFIGDNLQNLPYLSDSYYHVRWVIQVSNNNTVFKLYEDTEYKDTYDFTFRSNNTNYTLSTTSSDNGSVPRKYLFDISFLFKDTFVSSFGCAGLNSLSNQEHNVSFLMTMNTSYEKEWTIADNGFTNGYYTVFNSSIGSNLYTAYTPIDYQGKEFYSLSNAQNHVRTHFVNADYPTYQGNNVFTKFNQPLRDYVTCISNNKNKCCLEFC